jgi:hypothetical protein
MISYVVVLIVQRPKNGDGMLTLKSNESGFDDFMRALLTALGPVSCDAADVRQALLEQQGEEYGLEMIERSMELEGVRHDMAAVKRVCIELAGSADYAEARRHVLRLAEELMFSEGSFHRTVRQCFEEVNVLFGAYAVPKVSFPPLLGGDGRLIDKVGKE